MKRKIMSKFKPIIVIILVAILVIALCACVGDGNEKANKKIYVDIEKLTWLDGISVSDDGLLQREENPEQSITMTDLVRVKDGDYILIDSDNVSASGIELNVCIYDYANGEYKLLEKKSIVETKRIDFADGLVKIDGKFSPLNIRIEILRGVETNAEFVLNNSIDFIEMKIEAEQIEAQENADRFSTMLTKKDNKPIVIGHRGYDPYNYPENTMAAYKAAVENNLKIFETDILFTKDDVPVCLHDDTIDRTSNGTGKISSLTLEEVKKYDFGLYKGERFKGETVPTLKECLIFCKNNGISVEFDLTKKIFSYEEKKTIVDLVVEMGMENNTIFTSYPQECAKFLEINPNICICISGVSDISIASRELPKYRGRSGVLCSMSYKVLDEKFVNYIHSLGLLVKPWTIISTEDAQNMEKLGVDLMIVGKSIDYIK